MRYVQLFILSAFVFILQLVAVFFNRAFVGQIELLDFGMKAAANAAFTILLSITSSFILAHLFLFYWKPVSRNQKGEMLIKIMLVSMFPLLGVVFKLLFSMFGPRIFPFSFLRPGILEFSEWAIQSQIPSFWMGFVIGWLIKQKKSRSNSLNNL